MEQRRYYSERDYDDERRSSEKRRDSRYGYDMNGNVAYDFSLFEGRAVSYSSRTKQREQDRKKSGKSAAGKSRAAGKTAAKSAVSKAGQIDRRKLARGVAIGIIFAVAVGALLSCQVEYHELMQEISAANAQLSELQQEYTDLSVSFETKMSNSAIEEYATDVLGMQKRDNSQTEWVTIGGGDVFEYTTGDGTVQWLEEEFDKLLSYMD